MMNTILVTGGAGFIGSHTVELLLEQGKEVIVLDNLSAGCLNYLPLNHPLLEYVEGDILEYPLLMDIIGNCDAVLHLAAIASIPKTLAEPIYSFQVNVQGFLHIINAIQQSKRAIRLVYASSAAVYGEVKNLPCNDENDLSEKPLSPYALHKLDNEYYAELYKKLYQINSCGLRYFNVYGVRQDPNSPYSGVITHFLEAYNKQKPLTVFGDGLQSRDFISVKDVARANALALASDYAGVVNIATGKEQSLLELIKYIEAAGQYTANINFEAARVGDIRHSYATTNKAATHLNFKAQVSLQEGMSRLVTELEAMGSE